MIDTGTSKMPKYVAVSITPCWYSADMPSRLAAVSVCIPYGTLYLPYHYVHILLIGQNGNAVLNWGLIPYLPQHNLVISHTLISPHPRHLLPPSLIPPFHMHVT
jgi:hypothetical protein